MHSKCKRNRNGRWHPQCVRRIWAARWVQSATEQQTLGFSAVQITQVRKFFRSFSSFLWHWSRLAYYCFLLSFCSMYRLQWRRSGKRRSPEEGLPRGLCQSQTIARHWWWWWPSETRRISFDTHSEWRQQRQQRPWRWFRKWRRPQCTWHQRQSVSNGLVSMHFSWDFFPFFDGLVFLVIFAGIRDNILVCIVCALKHSHSFQHHTHTQSHKVTPTNKRCCQTGFSTVNDNNHSDSFLHALCLT